MAQIPERDGASLTTRLITGTRIIFFGIRKDLPYPVLTKDGQFSYTTYESSTLFFAPSTDTACPTGKQATGGDVAPTVTKSTTSSSTPEEGRSPNTVAANRSRKEDASSTTFSIKKTALCCDSIKLPECFPQYSSAIDAPDYNLASYMFWFHLHCSPALFLNGVQLCPQDAATPKQKQPYVTLLFCLNFASKFSCLRNESSKTITLWEYLHQALHYKVRYADAVWRCMRDSHYFLPCYRWRCLIFGYTTMRRLRVVSLDF